MDLFDMHHLNQRRKLTRELHSVDSRREMDRTAARDASFDLHERIERLTLLCEAMWQLLSETTGLTDEQLEAKLAALDGQDGEQDGRRTPKAVPCECGAKVAPGLKACQFCGCPVMNRNVFRAV